MQNQKNLVVKLNRKSRRDFFKSIQSKKMQNDKHFWKTMKPLFTDKTP